MKELQFEPAPGSTADLDYALWKEYIDECKRDNLRPSLSDFLIWMEEHDVHTTAE